MLYILLIKPYSIPIGYRVDYEKYPELEGIEYHVVDLHAGDCLYIPFKWLALILLSVPVKNAGSVLWKNAARFIADRPNL